MTISFHNHVNIPEGVLIREVGGESVILNINSEKYFGLDEIGTRFWEVITASDTLQLALDTLLAEYEVDEETLQRDLQNLVEQLIDNGLLELEEQP